MNNKFIMSQEDNIFYAKRKLVDNIHKSANLEGIKISLAETVEFINNINSGKLSIEEILKLKDLKDSWEFILNTINEDLTLNYIKKVHFQVCKNQNVSPLGEFRKSDVKITGTSWTPKLHNDFDYYIELETLLHIDNELERCINLFCWIQRSQMFSDGNKRVANLIANKEMIRLGQGIIAIPVEEIDIYLNKLINYYETGDNTELKNWLYENCIDGI